jgi:2-polyprenyl-3-methyl-5-hydroxy-6-metoxy-1,4-benzoquinol methylase
VSFQEIKECRSCKQNSFKAIISFGNQPLANSLRSDVLLSEEKYPLTLIECLNCTLIQLSIDVDARKMFDSYDWVTGTSRMAKDSALTLFDAVKQIMPLAISSAKICEIASNDGTFLLPFKSAGSTILGIEPAANLADYSNSLKIPTINKYFTSNLASEIFEKHGVQDLVIARNVLAHVPNPDDFMKGIATLIGQTGIGYIEVHNAASIFEGLQYDSIYHEHASYFSNTSLNNLCIQNGLGVIKFVESQIGGGNLGFFVKSRENITLKTFPIIKLENEKYDKFDWTIWAKKVEDHRDEINSYLKEKVNQSGVAFGASARGSTLLNYCNFQEKLKGIVDNNELKHGKFSPGLPLKISEVEKIKSLQPEYVFALAWNFEKEMLDQLKTLNYRGEVIIPFPKIRKFEI